MAGRTRYPLEAARALRADEESAVKDALAARLREQQEAEERVTQAQARLATHREETARVAQVERAADALGRSVAETLRAGDWLKRRGDESARLAKSVSDAVQKRVEAAAASERARAGLADARAAREAVEKHHAAWLAGERRAEESRAEAEADDLIAGRRPR